VVGLGLGATGGLGAVVDPAGQAVVALGVLEAVLAAGAGPVGAVGAGFGDVALVLGG